MIQINLLPENLRKTSKKDFLTKGLFRIPSEIIIGVGGGLIVLLIVLDLLLGTAIAFKAAKGQFYIQRKKMLLPEGKTEQIIANELREARMKIEGIQEILKGPTLVWSQQLNGFSDLMAKGVWLRKLNFEGKNFLIDGSSVSKTHNEMERLQEFLSNLKKDPLFIKFFQDPKLQDEQHRQINALDIVDFSINAQIK